MLSARVDRHRSTVTEPDMLIVSAADERFAAHFAAMLHSAWTHHPTAEFYLLDCGIEPGTLADLRAFASSRGIQLTFFNIDVALFRNLPTTRALSVATYARLLIPDLFPGSIERVLYLDADCIVVSDLTALWCFDMGNAAIAAVHDAIGAHLEREIGIEVDDQGYINSGVMLMNLAVWRRDKLAATAIAFVTRTNPRMLDQPGINAACAGKIAFLTEEWNFQLHKPRRPKQWLEPNIIHYSSEKKPWLHSDVLLAAIYLHHRNRTPFPIATPRAVHRSKLRRMLNLLIGRRKYWDQLNLARRCDAFTTAYFDRLPRRVATSAPASEVRNTPQRILIRTSES
jgi:lipopolysaccharide biosynthesis glycosyltransferase